LATSTLPILRRTSSTLSSATEVDREFKIY
jgi:hypothetical protein